MASFKYVGRDTSGKQVTGVIEAADSSAAAEQLTRIQIIPTAISAKEEKAESAANMDVRELLNLERVSAEELIVFCRQMYALMRSGVPILRAIFGLSESANSNLMKRTLKDVAQNLEGGRTLSSALNQHPKVFNKLFVSIIHVGENTGLLEESFRKLATYFERDQETKKRIKTAMRYPVFVLVAIIAALVVMNIFVIPTFANMFAKLGADLPWSTKLLMASSNAFLNYWHVMIALTVATIVGIKQYLKTEQGAYRWDRWKLKLPVVGSIIERSLLARFSHSFAIVLKAGVPMTNGLSLVADAVDNVYVKDKIITIRQGIEGGDSLLRTANASGLFTALVLQMIAVGEETGRVDELLEEVAEYYEREVDYDLTNLTAKIEPILVSVVAVMVLILALGIFTPMWDMMSAYKQ